jgi:hypothetical protein
LADDLLNDNYFTAFDAKAEIEANRYASHTGTNAYRDKRQSALNNASSVIADLTHTTAKQTEARNDFYAKSVPGIDLTTGSTGTSGGSSSGYGRSFFRGTYPHTNDPPNRPIFMETRTGGGTGSV